MPSTLEVVPLSCLESERLREKQPFRELETSESSNENLTVF